MPEVMMCPSAGFEAVNIARYTCRKAGTAHNAVWKQKVGLSLLRGHSAGTQCSTSTEDRTRGQFDQGNHARATVDPRLGKIPLSSRKTATVVLMLKHYFECHFVVHETRRQPDLRLETWRSRVAADGYWRRCHMCKKQ
jgi:hypothetical protein